VFSFFINSKQYKRPDPVIKEAFDGDKKMKEFERMNPRKFLPASRRVVDLPARLRRAGS